MEGREHLPAAGRCCPVRPRAEQERGLAHTGPPGISLEARHPGFHVESRKPRNPCEPNKACLWPSRGCGAGRTREWPAGPGSGPLTEQIKQRLALHHLKPSHRSLGPRPGPAYLGLTQSACKAPGGDCCVRFCWGDPTVETGDSWTPSGLSVSVRASSLSPLGLLSARMGSSLPTPQTPPQVEAGRCLSIFIPVSDSNSRTSSHSSQT